MLNDMGNVYVSELDKHTKFFILIDFIYGASSLKNDARTMIAFTEISEFPFWPRAIFFIIRPFR